MSRKNILLALAAVLLLASVAYFINAYSERHVAPVFGYPVLSSEYSVDFNTAYLSAYPFRKNFIANVNDNTIPDVVAVSYGLPSGSTTPKIRICVSVDGNTPSCHEYSLSSNIPSSHRNTGRFHMLDMIVNGKYLYFTYYTKYYYNEEHRTYRYYQAYAYSYNLATGQLSRVYQSPNYDHYYNGHTGYHDGVDDIFRPFVARNMGDFTLICIARESEYDDGSHTSRYNIYWTYLFLHNGSLFRSADHHVTYNYEYSSYRTGWTDYPEVIAISPSSSNILVATRYSQRHQPDVYRVYVIGGSPQTLPARPASADLVVYPAPVAYIPLRNGQLARVDFHSSNISLSVLDINTPAPFYPVYDINYLPADAYTFASYGTAFYVLQPAGEYNIPAPASPAFSLPSHDFFVYSPDYNATVAVDASLSVNNDTYTVSYTVYAAPPSAYALDLNVLDILDYDNNVSSVPVNVRLSPVYPPATIPVPVTVTVSVPDENTTSTYDTMSTDSLDANISIATPGDHNVLVTVSDTHTGTIYFAKTLQVHVLSKPYAVTIYKVVPEPRDLYLAATAVDDDVNSPVDLNYSWHLTIYPWDAAPVEYNGPASPAFHLDVNAFPELNSAEMVTACVTVTDPNGLSTTKCADIDVTETTKNTPVVVAGPPEEVIRKHRVVLQVPINVVPKLYSQLGIRVSPPPLPSSLSAVTVQQVAPVAGIIAIFAIIAFIVLH